MKRMFSAIGFCLVIMLIGSSLSHGCPMCDKGEAKEIDAQHGQTQSETSGPRNPHQFMANEMPKIDLVWGVPDGWNETLGKGLTRVKTGNL